MAEHNPFDPAESRPPGVTDAITDSLAAEPAGPENSADAPIAGEPPEEHPQQSLLPFHVVGIGASAGGLEAYVELLQALATDTGMAFIVIPHLSPDHESRMPEILSAYTTMPVASIQDGQRPEPNRVYVLPRGKQLTIASGVLRLTPRRADRHGGMTIDRFFCSLAADQKSHAMGVLLSGMDSDGALGLKAIKDEGGISMVQDPDSAQFGNMPRNAILADHVDLVSRPAEIARELGRIARRFFEPEVSTLSQGGLVADDATCFNRLLGLLRSVQGIEFRLYKPATLRRRIARRMMLKRVITLSDYTAYVQSDPAELQSLHEDVLINVTRFFRDPEVFAALNTRLIPAILSNRPADQQLRIWVAGCATGEEAYSIAMCVSEQLYSATVEPPVVIFGTDANERSIEKARAATYPETITADVSPERLRRFFMKTEHGYQISKRIRDLCIFARQNLCTDPPYSRLDLVSCRNVLIYLGSEIQRRVLTTFHYALRPNGHLLLGNAESIRDHTTLFTPVDRQHKIYVKAAKDVQVMPDALPRLPEMAKAGSSQSPVNEPELQRAADRIVLARYTPAGVVINERMEVLQIRGDITPYLHIAPGTPSFNLIRMAREGLSAALRGALQRVFAEDVPVIIDNVLIRNADEQLSLKIDVLPIHAVSGHTRTCLIVFQPRSFLPSARPEGGVASDDSTAEEPSEELPALRKDLASTRLYLQSLIEERDSRNQELTSAYEELQSANEELQSTNEELETAKEELQATNEELQTVNEELRNRNSALLNASNDLSNLLSSVNIPVVMLGNDLTIKLYTPPAERLMRIRRQDIGRPITEIRLNLMIEELEPLLQKVLDTLVLQELEVQDRQGCWHLLRVRPYRTTDNRIDGLVMVLLDIDEIRRGENSMRAARDFSRMIVETVPVPFVVLDQSLRIHSANGSFREMAGVSAADLENRSFPELTSLLWKTDNMRVRLEAVRESAAGSEWRFDHEVPGTSLQVLQFTVRSVHNEQERWLLLLVEDISARTRAERVLLSERDHLTDEVHTTAAELGHTKEELRALAARLFTAQEEERRRVARELHDDISQKLVLMDLDAAHLSEHVSQNPMERNPLVDSLRERITSLSQEVRAISHRLHPSILDDLGLAAALKSLVEDFGRRENMPSSFRSTTVQQAPSPDIAGGLYRISQEALRNIAKHAGHTQVKVTLSGTVDGLRLVIRDFGEGFDTSEIRERGLGLISMQERARLMGGNLAIESELGEGTTLTVSVPIANDRKD